ncbi:LrgB family protein [Bacillus lacus]|uniref:LrgB family protein n=1 Tax=Metabacillus lacus TaxID=1983721 RepID=A0A7X2IZT1_9BACI|nr:LrgB family protein [Metabacillus lacus]MRX72701.1 LrgB family protein [Metabacillus lacus]
MILFSLSMVMLTASAYFLSRKLYSRLPHPLLVPIVTSTAAIILVLLLLNIPYSSYMAGGKLIDIWLGPAVVALAFPLYRYRSTLFAYFAPVIAGILIGTVVGIVSGVYLSLLFRVDLELILSLAPKSVTTPVAMSISEGIGGIPPLAAVYVMCAGISGAMFGPPLLKVLRIRDSVAAGIGLGAASHGIGTAKALELGELEGAASSISMSLSALFAALLCPIIISIIL